MLGKLAANRGIPARYFATSSSFFNEKVRKMNNDSIRQAKQYADKLQPPKLFAKVDPKLRIKNTFFGAQVDNSAPNPLSDLGELSVDFLNGHLHTMDVRGLCSVSIVNDDILYPQHGADIKADMTLIPMSPNFMPYKGVGLRVIEKGGETFYRAALKEVRAKLEAKRAEVDSEVERLAAEAGVSVSQLDKTELERQVALQPGEVIMVPSHGAVDSELVGFVILPFFFQGNPLQAAKALSDAWGEALEAVNQAGVSSVVTPHVGRGIYGFEQARHDEILVETAIETMLQLSKLRPTYNLKSVTFVDADKKTARALGQAILEQEAQWVPEKKVVSAAEFYSRHERRILSVQSTDLKGLRRRTMSKMKQHHSITRRPLVNYRQNIRPFQWRRVGNLLNAPPLMVNATTGEGAHLDLQHAPRPYFRGNVSHTLFPSPRSTFGSHTRVDAQGNLRGINRMPRGGDGLDEINNKTRFELDGGSYK